MACCLNPKCGAVLDPARPFGPYCSRRCMALDLDQDVDDATRETGADEPAVEVFEADRRPGKPTRPAPFRMCKYCGERIVEAFNKWGKKSKAGRYCSPECAFDVEGFDNQLVSERRFKTTSFDPVVHDRGCKNTQTPAQIAIEDEQKAAGETDPETERQLDRLKQAHDLMARARAIDPRLPDILLGMENGETQESMAARWKIRQSTVSEMIKRLRATI